MPTIVYRLDKGVQLTNAEIDQNFRELVEELALKLDSSDYTSTEILSLLNAESNFIIDGNI